MSGPAGQSPFPIEALEVNRAGRLTEAQHKVWTGSDRNWRGNVRLMALVLGLGGVLLVVGIGQTPLPALARLAIGTACLIVSAALIYVSTLGGGALTRDLRDGRVEAVEGAIIRDPGLRLYTGANPERCYLNVGNMRLACSRPAYDAAPQAGIVRVYYLPRSRRVVNLERLADRPLPAGALAHPLAVAGEVLPAIVSNDRTQRAEAMATLKAMKDAIVGEVSSLPTGTTSSRPLAEAIVGRWHSPVMDVTFTTGGHAAATMANGMTLAGRWAVAGEGTLRLSGMGQDAETEASVVGDALTVVMDGDRMTFRRVGNS